MKSAIGYALSLALLAVATTRCASPSKSGGGPDATDSSSSDGRSAAKNAKTTSEPSAPSAEESAPAKPSRPLTTAPARFVTTALVNDGGIEGSISQQSLQEVLPLLDDLTNKEPENVPLLVTYMGLLRLYGENPSLLQSISQKAGTVGAKNPWFLLESAYVELKDKNFSKAEFLLEKARANAAGNPMIKAAVTHAFGIRYILDNKLQIGIAEIRKSAQGDVPFLPSLLTLGFLGLKYGDLIGAEKNFRAAGAVAPMSLNVRIGLAAALRARGKLEEAIAILQGLYKSRPNDRRITFNYALALGDGNGASQKQSIDLLNKYYQLAGNVPDIDQKAGELMTKLSAAQMQNQIDSAAGGGAGAAPAGGQGGAPPSVPGK